MGYAGGHGGCLHIVLSDLQNFSGKCRLRVNEWPLQIRRYYRSVWSRFCRDSLAYNRYPVDYAREEEVAGNSKAGMWQDEFMQA